VSVSCDHRKNFRNSLLLWYLEQVSGLLFSRKLFIYGNSSISSILWFDLNNVGVRTDVSIELGCFPVQNDSE
jgi:hypothetical protein